MSPQSTIAHYRIAAKLGEGGMGEVWRATDTKLNRDVAIKILPEAFAADADRLARFTREAQVLASLNHPNIAAIYGVEERALILELVEGPTLAERIAQGAIPLEEALPIFSQIVDALEYAHEKSVIHRDLKPANIKLTPEGKVKVLDFGLAKALTSDPAASDPLSSPTLTMRATQIGAIMGTAAYMSPEQARGHSVDKRADIWAFGVVVHEMLTGRQLFGGPTISDTLASVLKEEPEWESIPVKMRKLLRLCMAKDPRRRLRDIGDARALLDDAPEAVAVPTQPAAAPLRRGVLAWATGLLSMALLVTGALLWRATRPPDRPMMRFSAELGPDGVAGDRIAAAISPDGTRLVYSVRTSNSTQLATRLLDQPNGLVYPGTEGADDPFFSPDGQWIGFFAEGKMKKVAVQGGAALTLCDATNPRGAAWGEDHDIIANLDLLHLYRVPETGGMPQMISNPADRGERTHRWPQILPGGQTVLFTGSKSAGGLGYEDSNLEVLSLKTGKVKIVQGAGYYGRYLSSGHLVYVHQGTLFGVPFDLARLETRGIPAPILHDVAANPIYGSGRFVFSQNGTFLYISGKSAGAATPVAWMDSAGKTEPLLTPAGPAQTPRLSPDGKRLALSVAGELFVYDPQRGATTKLTFNGLNNRCPVWTPDGKHIIFGSNPNLGGAYGMWWIRADGSGQPQVLFESKDTLLPYSISPDGRRLAFTQADAPYSRIFMLPLDTSDPDRPKAGQPEPFLSETTSLADPAFSPDGHWLAYHSVESGDFHVFVRPFPLTASSGKWQVSTTPGRFPVWSRNGRELFYMTPANRIMVAGYTAKGESFVPEKPRPWSETAVQRPVTNSFHFDLAPDGKRVVVFPIQGTQGDDKAAAHVTVLLNFFDELRRKLP